MNRLIIALLLLGATGAGVLFAACGGDDEPVPESLTPSATPSPAPANAIEARQVLDEFVSALAAGDLQAAWRLYTASIPAAGLTHRPDFGCEFVVFQNEFPKLKNLFQRLAPFETVGSFPIEGTGTVELRLRGQDGVEYLATLHRVEPAEPYRLRFFNSGQVSQVPGAPDPLPSPEDPQGYCGIWTGGR
jgi:hypothetical protein